MNTDIIVYSLHSTSFILFLRQVFIPFRPEKDLSDVEVETGRVLKTFSNINIFGNTIGAQRLMVSNAFEGSISSSLVVSPLSFCFQICSSQIIVTVSIIFVKGVGLNPLNPPCSWLVISFVIMVTTLGESFIWKVLQFDVLC